jgi:hypothetical protein
MLALRRPLSNFWQGEMAGEKTMTEIVVIMMCDVCVLVCFVVSGVKPPGFSKFAGNIINLGINTILSRKLLTSNPDKK